MIGKTHMTGGLVAGLIVSQQLALPLKETAIITTISIFAALIPDIDIPTSKIGHITRPLSTMINGVFGHRKLFHSFLLYGALAGLAIYSFPQYISFILAVSLGIASHIILDIFTPEGVPVLYPIVRKNFGIVGIPTGGIMEVGFSAALMMTAGVLIYNSGFLYFV